MDRHPNGDLKLRDWIRATEVSPERAADARASAEAETRRRRAREARRREWAWAGCERATRHEFGPTWRFPTPGGIAKKDMG